MWKPDIRPDQVMRDAIDAHVGVHSHGRETRAPGVNALVIFTALDDAASLNVLSSVLQRTNARYAPLSIILVTPAGTFDRTRREIDAQLAPLTERLPFPVHLTEDDERGWSRTFDVKTPPAAFVVDAERRVVWKSYGTLDADALQKALREHLIPAPFVRAQPMRLTLAMGDRALDLSFLDAEREPHALHRMRGRRVLLNFWQSWSAPSLDELRRLQGVFRGEKGSLAIVSLHGGDNPDAVDVVRKQYGLEFPIVHDGEQRIARKYGVNCWPTTITIDSRGRVEQVQFGRGRGRERDGE
jgi:peroxiredoxin